MKFLGIDHVAVAVNDIDGAIAILQKLFSVKAESREYVASQKTEVALIPFSNAVIELIQPKGNEGLARFLEKRGPGLHHVAVSVDNIEEVLRALQLLQFSLIDETPRIGARGHFVAFIHPKSTGGILVELVQHASAQTK